MKTRLIKLVIGLVIVIGTYLGSFLLNKQKSYSLDEVMSFVASCGSFIKGSFENVQRNQADYFIVIISAVIVVLTLGYSLKYLLKPNEKEADHIKFKILERFKDEKVS